MLAVIVMFVLLAWQPMPMTVEECLLRSGYSRAVTPTQITALRGAPAPEWETVLSAGQVAGVTYASTDSGRRLIIFYAWDGALYVFIGKSEHDPGVRLPGEARSVVHGDCLLRVGG